MATETMVSPAGDDIVKQEKKQQQLVVSPPAPAPAPTKQISNAAKKALQKAEKLARRAQAKAAAPPQPVKESSEQKKGTSTSSTHQPQKPVIAVVEKKPAVPACFSHLSMARRIPPAQADKDVHPAVLALGQQMSSFALTDSIGRLQGTLLALKKVMDSYTTPQGSSFSRHFVPHVLNPQIDYLSACRPMCFCMGSAVRWLKLKISKLDTDADDMEAKTFLHDQMDDFLIARIAVADSSVVDNAADHIQDGDVVATFGNHRLVESTLRFAHAEGKIFSAVVLDDPVDKSGQTLAYALAEAGVKTAYLPSLGGADAVLSQTTKVMFGAESMFSNGAMYGRAGSADVALFAADYDIPVVVLCHSFNFTERTATDSLTYNEIDPDRHTDADFRLLFDTTENVTTVVTDVGSSPPRSAACVLRRWEDI